MTRQIRNYVEYEDHKYILIHNTSRELHALDLIEVKPNGMTTAGNHSATYLVQNGKFYLNKVWIWHSITKEEFSNLPKINDALPHGQLGSFEYEDGLGRTDWVSYEGIEIPFLVSGHVTMGLEEVEEYKRTMFDPMPRHFETVLRLTLSNGKITKVEDLSDVAKTIRDIDQEIMREITAMIENGKVSIDELLNLKYREDDNKALRNAEECIVNPTQCEE